MISFDTMIGRKKGAVNRLIARASPETLISPADGECSFASHEIRRAVDLYAEEFCLYVEDTLAAFWTARQGGAGLGLPIWLQNSSSNYLSPVVESSMGEAVAGYLMEIVFGARLYHRPRGRAPGIYMTMPDGFHATVEAKATVLKSDSLHSQLVDAVFDTLTVWAHIDIIQRLEDLKSFCVGVGINQAGIQDQKYCD